VVAILIAIVVFIVFPLKSIHKNSSIFNKIFYVWAASLLILSWIGGCPVEWPYDILRKVACFLYFFLVFLLFIV
jgi:ubiquinol-cytochrome c reductase cytochrome b subunit